VTDIQKPQGEILRRNPERECGVAVGQVSVAVHGLPGFQTISFFCNKPLLHNDQCAFVGKDVIVQARRESVIIRNSK
jgi:hypothetical protein